jgi:hypothetical protein
MLGLVLWLMCTVLFHVNKWVHKEGQTGRSLQYFLQRLTATLNHPRNLACVHLRATVHIRPIGATGRWRLLSGLSVPFAKGSWLRGLDSNQDSRLQRPMCYQLHHPGVVAPDSGGERTLEAYRNSHQSAKHGPTKTQVSAAYVYKSGGKFRATSICAND